MYGICSIMRHVKFHFTVCLVTLSVAQNVECRVVELMQNESKRVWKEAILVLESHRKPQ